uniref:Uncharacterized protein n=1 Tax=Timema douglasi TaxID=61478 RepID=A0A7R8VHJ9_TIMDO|nr:unnamed protein product [Timema douglasi]
MTELPIWDDRVILCLLRDTEQLYQSARHGLYMFPSRSLQKESGKIYLSLESSSEITRCYKTGASWFFIEAHNLFVERFSFSRRVRERERESSLSVCARAPPEFLREVSPVELVSRTSEHRPSRSESLVIDTHRAPRANVPLLSSPTVPGRSHPLLSVLVSGGSRRGTAATGGGGGYWRRRSALLGGGGGAGVASPPRTPRHRQSGRHRHQGQEASGRANRLR